MDYTDKDNEGCSIVIIQEGDHAVIMTHPMGFALTPVNIDRLITALIAAHNNMEEASNV